MKTSSFWLTLMFGKAKYSPNCAEVVPLHGATALVPPRPLWQLFAVGSSMRPRCSGGVDAGVSLVGSICHHWMPLWLSIGLPVPPMVVPAACGLAESMTVCVVHSFPLRSTEFWMRESFAAMREPERSEERRVGKECRS